VRAIACARRGARYGARRVTFTIGVYRAGPVGDGFVWVVRDDHDAVVCDGRELEWTQALMHAATAMAVRLANEYGTPTRPTQWEETL